MKFGSVIAVIPARGGSKRIPRKNLVEFAGKPLLAWTIDAAVASGIFADIIVSTEDRDIAETARTLGAKVPFLRVASFDDHSPVSLATIEAVNQYREYAGNFPDVVVQLLPTCPFRTPKDVILSVSEFVEKGRELQISCGGFGFQNPWWSLSLQAGGSGTSLFPNALQERSQDLAQLYCPTGAIWIARTEALLATGSFYGPQTCYVPLNWLSSFDIDTVEDLKIASILAAGLHQGLPRP